MGPATDLVLSKEYGHLGSWSAIWDPGLDRVHLDGLENNPDPDTESPCSGVGLDGSLLCLAVFSMEQHHALSAADLSPAGLICGLVDR